MGPEDVAALSADWQRLIGEALDLVDRVPQPLRELMAGETLACTLAGYRVPA